MSYISLFVYLCCILKCYLNVLCQRTLSQVSNSSSQIAPEILNINRKK